MATADRFALAVRSGRLEEAAAMFADYWGGAGTWSTMDPRRRRNQAALMPKVFAEFKAVEQVRRHLPPWLQFAETNPRHDRRAELAAA